jgi:hypothetical protein
MTSKVLTPLAHRHPLLRKAALRDPSAPQARPDHLGLVLMVPPLGCRSTHSHLPIERAPRQCKNVRAYHSDPHIRPGDIWRVAARQFDEEGVQFLCLPFGKYRAQLIRADPKTAKNSAVNNRLPFLEAAQVQFDIDGVVPSGIEQRPRDG